MLDTFSFIASISYSRSFNIIDSWAFVSCKRKIQIRVCFVFFSWNPSVFQRYRTFVLQAKLKGMPAFVVEGWLKCRWTLKSAAKHPHLVRVAFWRLRPHRLFQRRHLSPKQLVILSAAGDLAKKECVPWKGVNTGHAHAYSAIKRWWMRCSSTRQTNSACFKTARG